MHDKRHSAGLLLVAVSPNSMGCNGYSRRYVRGCPRGLAVWILHVPSAGSHGRVAVRVYLAASGEVRVALAVLLDRDSVQPGHQGSPRPGFLGRTQRA